MKTPVLFIIFILLSCRNPQRKIRNSDSVVTGKWMINTIIYSGIHGQSDKVLCNACPYINFFKNHSGFIKRPDNIIFHFTWATDNDKLIITYPEKHKVEDDIIDNGIYKIINLNKKPPRSIVLINSLKDIKYMLN